MNLQAFDVEAYSGTARRANQRLLASTAACKKHWIIASLDISVAFLKGLTYRELAEATGEKEREVCFTLPPGSASALRTLPGFSPLQRIQALLEMSETWHRYQRRPAGVPPETPVNYQRLWPLSDFARRRIRDKPKPPRGQAR